MEEADIVGIMVTSVVVLVVLAAAAWALARRRSTSMVERTPAEVQAMREAEAQARRRGPGTPGADRTFGGGGS